MKFGRKHKTNMWWQLSFCCSIAVLMLSSGVLQARVTYFKPTTSQYFGTFKSGTYIKLTGNIKGELATNEAIPDLSKSDKEYAGKVSYETDIELIIPEDPGLSNGTLIFDVKNRGKTVAHFLYNSPRGVSVTNDDIGLGFLEDEGFMIATANWELGHGITLPSFIDAGQKRFVEAVGLAAVRDIIVFFKYQEVDDEGNINPLYGAVQSAVGVGYSQSALFLKTSLLNGFNWMHGRKVFDGLHLHASHAGQLPIMGSGPGPFSSGVKFPTYSHPDISGVHVSPFTYQQLVTELSLRGETPPRIVVTNTTSDYYSLRASLARTGVDGTADVEIPKNVRIYDIAGSAHIILPYRGCTTDRGNLDWHPLMRSTLLNLHYWVSRDLAPPESQLMPLEHRPDDPAILAAPPDFPDALLQVPQRDKDGNDIGGVRLPEIQVPIATYSGQNGPVSSVLCTLSGSYSPFPFNKRKRSNSRDSRISIKERYASKNVYVDLIAQAARALIEAGFLLDSDAWMINHAAAVNKTVR